MSKLFIQNFYNVVYEKKSKHFHHIFKQKNTPLSIYKSSDTEGGVFFETNIQIIDNQ